MAGFYRRIMSWLDERFGAGSIEEFLRHKTIPIHRHTIWYYFGGMTLFLFVVQVLTGILLLLYYRPTPDDAFESVQYIMTQVQFGWLIRSVHSWSANLMIFTAFVHMFSVYFLKAYRKPRELTWVTGMLLLFVVLGFGFSGYLLPWNTLAFFATKVGTDMAGFVPVIGKWILDVPARRQGSDGRDADALLRIPRRGAAGSGDVAAGAAPSAGAAPGDERAAERRARDRGRQSAAALHALLPQLPAARHDRLVRRAGRAGRARRHLPLGTGHRRPTPSARRRRASVPNGISFSCFKRSNTCRQKFCSWTASWRALGAFSLAGALWVVVPFLDYKAGFGRTTRFFTGLGVFALGYIVLMSALALVDLRVHDEQSPRSSGHSCL